MNNNNSEKPDSYQYDSHIFVCINVREGENARPSCGLRGGKEIHARLKQRWKARKDAGLPLPPKMRVNKSMCLDYCEEGPCLVAYPKANWVFPKDADEAEAWFDAYIDAESK